MICCEPYSHADHVKVTFCIYITTCNLDSVDCNTVHINSINNEQIPQHGCFPRWNKARVCLLIKCFVIEIAPSDCILLFAFAFRYLLCSLVGRWSPQFPMCSRQYRTAELHTLINTKFCSLVISVCSCKLL